MKLALQIAAGIVMASAVIGVSQHLYRQAQLRTALEAMQQVQADVTRQDAQRRAQFQAAQARQAERLDDDKHDPGGSR
jgi:hypothetical protein